MLKISAQTIPLIVQAIHVIFSWATQIVVFVSVMGSPFMMQLCRTGRFVTPLALLFCGGSLAGFKRLFFVAPTVEFLLLLVVLFDVASLGVLLRVVEEGRVIPSPITVVV